MSKQNTVDWQSKPIARTIQKIKERFKNYIRHYSDGDGDYIVNATYKDLADWNITELRKRGLSDNPKFDKEN